MGLRGVLVSLLTVADGFTLWQLHDVLHASTIWHDMVCYLSCGHGVVYTLWPCNTALHVSRLWHMASRMYVHCSHAVVCCMHLDDGHNVVCCM